jgi:hypothetical protein
MNHFARFIVALALPVLCGAAFAQGVNTGGDNSGMARKPGTQGATGSAGASSPSAPSAAPQVSPPSASPGSAEGEQVQRRSFGDPTRRPRPTTPSGASSN